MNHELPDPPPPFPQWLMRIDPLAARWEENGVYTAFRDLRKKRLRWYDRILFVVDDLFGSGLLGWVGMTILPAAFLASLLFRVFFQFCFALLVVASIPLVVSLMRPKAKKLPYYLQELFRVREFSSQVLNDIRVLPVSSETLGETLMLERTEREWKWLVIKYLLLSSIAICGAALPTVLQVSHIPRSQWGAPWKVALLLVLVYTAWKWAPAIIGEDLMRRRRSALAAWDPDRSEARQGRRVLFIEEWVTHMVVVPVVYNAIPFILIGSWLMFFSSVFRNLFDRLDDLDLTIAAGTSLQILLLLLTIPLARIATRRMKESWRVENSATAYILGKRIERLLDGSES